MQPPFPTSVLCHEIMLTSPLHSGLPVLDHLRCIKIASDASFPTSFSCCHRERHISTNVDHDFDLAALFHVFQRELSQSLVGLPNAFSDFLSFIVIKIRVLIITAFGAIGLSLWLRFCDFNLPLALTDADQNVACRRLE